jgi:hypothetical protein
MVQYDRGCPKVNVLCVLTDKKVYCPPPCAPLRNRPLKELHTLTWWNCGRCHSFKKTMVTHPPFKKEGALPQFHCKVTISEQCLPRSWTGRGLNVRLHESPGSSPLNFSFEKHVTKMWNIPSATKSWRTQLSHFRLACVTWHAHVVYCLEWN